MKRPSFDKEYIIRELDRLSSKVSIPVKLLMIGGMGHPRKKNNNENLTKGDSSRIRQSEAILRARTCAGTYAFSLLSSFFFLLL